MHFISIQEAEDRTQAEGRRSLCPYAAGHLAGRQAYVVALQPSNTLAIISGLGKDAIGEWGPAQGSLSYAPGSLKS